MQLKAVQQALEGVGKGDRLELWFDTTKDVRMHALSLIGMAFGDCLVMAADDMAVLQQVVRDGEWLSGHERKFAVSVGSCFNKEIFAKLVGPGLSNLRVLA